MKKSPLYLTRLFLLVGALLLCSTWLTPVQATLIEADDPVFGPASITVDTDTGLGWLDLTFPVNMSFVDVAAELGAGGNFEGFRHATRSEVETLFMSAGIPDIDAGGTAANIEPVTALIVLIGATTFQGSYPETFGMVSDVGPVAGSRLAAKLDFYFSDGTPVYAATTLGTIYSESIAYPTVGHWLVIPEPMSSLLFGVGVAALWLRRRQQKYLLKKQKILLDKN